MKKWLDGIKKAIFWYGLVLILLTLLNPNANTVMSVMVTTLTEPKIVVLYLVWIFLRQLFKVNKNKKWVRVIILAPMFFSLIVLLVNIVNEYAYRFGSEEENLVAKVPTTVPTKAPKPYKPFTTIFDTDYNFSFIRRNFSYDEAEKHLGVWRTGDNKIYNFDGEPLKISVGTLVNSKHQLTNANGFYLDIKNWINNQPYHKIFSEEEIKIDGQVARIISYEIEDSAADCQAVISLPNKTNQFIHVFGWDSGCDLVVNNLKFSNIYEDIQTEIRTNYDRTKNETIYIGRAKDTWFSNNGLKVVFFDKQGRITTDTIGRKVTKSEWEKPSMGYADFEIRIDSQLVDVSEYVVIYGQFPDQELKLYLRTTK